MDFQYLIQERFVANHCFMLNRWFTFNGSEILLVAIVSRDDEDALYYMSRSIEAADTGEYLYNDFEADPLYVDSLYLEELIHPKTHRKEMEHRLRQNEHHNAIFSHISKVALCGQTLQVTSSRGDGFNTYNPKTIMALQYFLEHEIDLSPWACGNTPMDQITLHECVLSERFTYDIQPISPNETISITFAEQFTEIALKEGVVATVNRVSDTPQTLEYIDPKTSETHTVFINKISEYDARNEENSPFKGEVPSGITEDQFEEMKVQYMHTMDTICPKGMVFALIEYETDDDQQVDIYDTLNLDRETSQPEKIGDGPEVIIGSSVGMLFRPEEPIGPNGHKNRLTLLRPVYPNTVASFDIEILSKWYVTPEVTLVLD